MSSRIKRLILNAKDLEKMSAKNLIQSLIEQGLVSVSKSESHIALGRYGTNVTALKKLLPSIKKGE